MKNRILSILLTTISVAVFAQKNSGVNDGALVSERISVLIDDSLLAHSEEIYSLSAQLPQTERERLYDENSQNALKVMLLNLTPFGLGSFIAHDRVGGYVQLCGNVLGWAELVTSLCMFSIPETTSNPSLSKDSSSYYNNFGAAFLICGLSTIFISQTYGLVRPWSYTRHYNRQLKSDLRLQTDSRVSVQFSPLANPLSQDYGLVASIHF